MLRVMNPPNVNAPEFEFDEYIPLVVRWPITGESRPFYWWSANDAKGSFLEIGLSAENGIICELTLTSIAEFSPLLSLEEDGAKEVIYGRPVCDLMDWPLDGDGDAASRFKSENINFHVQIGVDRIVVRFSVPELPHVKYIAGNVVFNVTLDGNLCSIEFNSIEKKHIRHIKHIIEGGA
jgi:hypothetical protein